MTELPNETELVEPENLIPYSNNPKKHPPEQVDKIASSIKNYGFIQPIVTDQNNEVIIGHGRLQAAKKLGLGEVPVIKHEDLSESEVKALRLADNRIAETEWEEEQLAVELEQLTEEEDFQDLITGFNEDELSEYLDSLTDEEDLTEPESEDPEQVETSIQEGEIFKLGKHRLMCGDATNNEHVEALMNGAKADMVFTDPPYGKEYDGRSDAHKQILNDDLSDKQITEFYKLGRADEKYYCLDSERLPVLFEAQGMPKSLIVWDKGHFGMGDGYRRQYELIAYYGDYSGTTESDVWKINRDNTGGYKHPTQKPVELPARALKNSSNQEDIVLDLFAGSGSTLLACEQTQRKAYCMELDPQYVQVIINRWEELTGKKAEPIEA